MMRVRHPWIGAFAMSLTILAVSVTVAQAQKGPDWFGRSTNKMAIKELETGNKFYIQRDFEKAIEFYKSGQMIDNAPIFLYNIGQSYRQLGDYKQAIWYYEQWLAAYQPPANSKARKAVEKWLKQMRAELEEQARKEPPLEAAPDTGDGPEVGEGEEEDVDETDRAALPGTSPWYSDGLGWGLVGGGVAAVVTGGAMLGSASGKESDANDALSETRRNELRDQADTRRVVGYVLGGVGAALTIGGIVSFAIPSRSKEKRTTRAWLRVSPNGLAVGGRF